MTRLFENETDTQKICRFVLEVVKENGKTREDIKLFDTLIEILKSHLRNNKENLQTRVNLIECARSLMNENAIYPRWFGHLLHLRIYSSLNTMDKETEIPVEFAEEFRTTLNILDEIRKNHNEYLTKQYIEFGGFFKFYDKVITKYNLDDDSVDLKEKFINIMKQEGHCNYHAIGNVINSLSTQLWEKQEYKHGYDLLNEFLQLNGQGLERLSQERIRFKNAMQETDLQNINQIVKIEFDDKRTDYVKIIINSENGLYGIRAGAHDSLGQVFKLVPAEKKARILSEISGEVCDIASTGRFIGVATKANGFYLIDTQNMKMQHFTPDNSSIPSQYIANVSGTSKNFLVSIRDRFWGSSQRYQYIIEPETTNISLCNENVFFSSVLLEKAEEKKLKLSYQRSNTGTEILIISSNTTGYQLMRYEGFELIQMADFELWQEQLIFATNSSLYISKPGSNSIHSIPNKDNLLFYCLRPTDDELYIGTSNGLYCIGAEQFLALVEQVEEID
ncbi:MAG: hypothetical protein JXA96_05440 [Sedimentisphaerales bacterium]|nr:hypothetical protein [Sedimentisphaerales bacterium]